MFGNPIRTRNALLIAGIIMFIIAVIKEPSLIIFFRSTKGIASAFMVCIAAIIVACWFSSFCNHFLKDYDLSWYTHKAAILLMPSMFILFSIFASFIDTFVLAAIGLNLIWGNQAYIYEFGGMTVIWIVLLDWVSYE